MRSLTVDIIWTVLDVFFRWISINSKKCLYFSFYFLFEKKIALSSYIGNNIFIWIIHASCLKERSHCSYIGINTIIWIVHARYVRSRSGADERKRRLVLYLTTQKLFSVIKSEFLVTKINTSDWPNTDNVLQLSAVLSWNSEKKWLLCEENSLL